MASLLNDAHLQLLRTCPVVSNDPRAKLQDSLNISASCLRKNLGFWRSCRIRCGLLVTSGALLQPCHFLKRPAQSRFLLGQCAGTAAQPCPLFSPPTILSFWHHDKSMVLALLSRQITFHAGSLIFHRGADMISMNEYIFHSAALTRARRSGFRTSFAFSHILSR